MHSLRSGLGSLDDIHDSMFNRSPIPDGPASLKRALLLKRKERFLEIGLR